MQVSPGKIYHVFNRGNNRQLIFYTRENYLYFLRKVRKHIHPYCDILGYCLMPNHFHFLIRMNETSVIPKIKKPNEIVVNQFSAGLKTLLRSYAQAINKQEDRTGSLFTQNTEIKPTFGASIMNDYAVWCFIYIHWNAAKAGLVKHPKFWEFCSYPDYCGVRNGTLCNKLLAAEELDFELNEFYEFTDRPVSTDFDF